MDGGNAIRESCPCCRKVLCVPPAYAGLLVQCKFCEAKFWIPKTEPSIFRAICKGCDKPLRIPKRYAGHKVECSHCGHAFKVRPRRTLSGSGLHRGSRSTVGKVALMPAMTTDLPDDQVIL